MEWTPAEKDIYKNIKARFQAELYDALKCELATCVVRRVEGTMNKKTENLKEFMEETTVNSNNKKDCISLQELHKKFQDWMRANNKSTSLFLDDVTLLGKYLRYLPEYVREKTTICGKTQTVIRNLKYKNMELNKVKEFLDKYTEKTGDAKDRISIDKLIYIHNHLEYDPRVNESSFKYKAVLGEYRIKTCYEQLVKGPNRLQKPCLMDVKATNDLKELFKNLPLDIK